MQPAEVQVGPHKHLFLPPIAANLLNHVASASAFAFHEPHKRYLLVSENITKYKQRGGHVNALNSNFLHKECFIFQNLETKRLP